mgnify:CR=1 FL=1|jgi:hypothetical protein|tara:strand:- start:100 stop:561 length:462 start_codon:yes stop_codon:yes gene_type:complete
MITHTAKDGTETKYTVRQYRKFFAETKGKELQEEIIKALKDNLDKLDSSGHNINDPTHYINDVKLPAEFICNFARKHYSNYSDYKSTLYDRSGSMVDYIFGCNNLSVLSSLCNIVGWDKAIYEHYCHVSGRGFSASLCYQNLVKQLNYQSKKD